MTVRVKDEICARSKFEVKVKGVMRSKVGNGNLLNEGEGWAGKNERGREGICVCV